MGDIGSVFEAFFGGGGARPDASSDFGGDREATIELTVEDAYHGGERSISLVHPVPLDRDRLVVLHGVDGKACEALRELFDSPGMRASGFASSPWREAERPLRH